MNRIVIDADLGGCTISRHLYGHFAEHLGRCIYGGFWVGEDSPIPNTRGIRNDLVAALRAARIPNLRWPGGCFADEYHWQDGIGPRAQRPVMVNTHWGGVTENNHFGTHEFMDLCAQLGCEPYICGNVGSGTVREMQQWVEYLTSAGDGPMSELRRRHGRAEPWPLTYWGVGNENWGCGGNMRPEYYADEFRRYATYLRNFGEHRLYKIACGAYGDLYHWTEVLMREAGRFMDGLSFHNYFGSGCRSRSATRFDEGDWFHLLKVTLALDDTLTRHEAIMDRYDPQRRVGMIVDEWGTWHEVEPGTNPGFLFQQNSLRDALSAGIALNILNRHCARVRMANIAQTINVLQAMALTEGAKMLLTPTYHVFAMYAVHHDAVLLPLYAETEADAGADASIPGLHACASRAADGHVHLSVCNLNPGAAAEVTIEVRGAVPRRVRGSVLTAAAITAHNTFEQPDQVRPVPFADARVSKGKVTCLLPAKSVAVLQLV